MSLGETTTLENAVPAEPVTPAKNTLFDKIIAGIMGVLAKIAAWFGFKILF